MIITEIYKTFHQKMTVLFSFLNYGSGNKHVLRSTHKFGLKGSERQCMEVKLRLLYCGGIL